jgi:hypothetical protein
MCDNNSITNNTPQKVTTMKSYNITIIEPWSNREVRHLDVPQSQLKDIDGETWFTGYNEPIEVITAELVSEESQAAKAAYFAKWGTASE